MSRFWNHFLGSLFSRQAVFAYGSGSTITTTLVFLYFIANNFWPEPRVFTADLAGIEILVDMYLRVVLPIWVPPITWVELGVVGLNCLFGTWFLPWWSAKYADSATGSKRGF